MSSTQILAAIQSIESQLAILKGLMAPVDVDPKIKIKESKDKEKKPMSEGVRLWNVLIAETLEQMKSSNWTKPASRKDAMAVASAHKKAAAPPSPAKGNASPKDKVQAPPSSPNDKDKGDASPKDKDGAESDHSKSSKKGPKKGSHWSDETKASAAAKRLAKKTTVPLPASPEESEAEDEMVKTILDGKTYFINSKTNAAYRDGSFEGLFNGASITEGTEPK